MDEQQLFAELQAIHKERRQVSDAPAVRQQLLALPLHQTPQQRSWLPRLDAARFQSMFSATKFVVAGAVVALFGGFLLAGMLPTQPSDEQVPVAGASASTETEPTDVTTASPEPTVPPASDTTAKPTLSSDEYADMRARLATERVAPHIDRVLDDGAGHAFYRAGDQLSEGSVFYSGVAFAPDGSAWMYAQTIAEDGFRDLVFRVGEAGALTGGMGPGPDSSDLAVAPDGTIWALRSDDSGQTHVVSLEDGEWVRHESESVSHYSLEVLADGSVWTRDRTALRRLDGDGWTVFPFSEAGVSLPAKDGRWVFDHDLAAAPDGTLWLALDTTDGQGGLARFDGTSWERFDPLGRSYQSKADAVAVGDGGVVWAALVGCRGQGCLEDDKNHRYFLARFDGEEWTVLDEDDGAGQTNAPGGWTTKMVVSPDGLLLTTLRRGQSRVVLFDADGRRATIQDVFSPMGTRDIKAAPDGSFWVIAGGNLYIHDPNAVEAYE